MSCACRIGCRCILVRVSEVMERREWGIINGTKAYS
jgi:hypothetical protein